MPRTQRSSEKAAFQLLISRYKADPLWFEQNLPDIAEIVHPAVSQSRRSRSPFVLTEREREFHINALPDPEVMSKLSYEDAIEALKHSAYLIRDDSLPGYMRYMRYKRLLRCSKLYLASRQARSVRTPRYP